MKNYKSVYSFNVLDEIKAGKYVYMLDRLKRTVECVNELEVEIFADVLVSVDKEKGRFEFWIEEKEENK